MMQRQEGESGHEPAFHRGMETQITHLCNKPDQNPYRVSRDFANTSAQNRRRHSDGLSAARVPVSPGSCCLRGVVGGGSVKTAKVASNSNNKLEANVLTICLHSIENLVTSPGRLADSAEVQHGDHLFQILCDILSICDVLARKPAARMSSCPVFAGEWSSLDIKLCPAVRIGLEKLGYTHLTPVQAATIPLFVNHKDVTVQACTGSGKTLAFAVPIAHILATRETPLSDGHVGAIVVVPTRELAKQVADVLGHFVQKIDNVHIRLLIGGQNDPDDDCKTLSRSQGGSVVVGTPGRLNAVLEKVGRACLRQLEVLILDEADKLLDLGFERTINDLLALLPKQRRTGLFSATQTQDVMELTRAGLRNPVSVVVESSASQHQTPLALQSFYTIVPCRDKLTQLVQFLHDIRGKKVLVYFLTCACVEYFGKVLPQLEVLEGLNFVSLHGKMPQKKRTGRYGQFVDMSEGIMLTTDVAARGLDVPNVDWVVQFDAPQVALRIVFVGTFSFKFLVTQDPAMFVHRCGRTARLGKSGQAVVFLLPSEDSYVEFLHLRKVPLEPRTMTIGSDVDATPALRKLSLEDRDIFESSQVAFVSFIRAYREHQCSLIFRLKDLDLGDLAMQFGLVKMPNMPELKRRGVARFQQVEDLDTDSIKYKDVIREKARQVRLSAVISAPHSQVREGRRSSAFSRAKERRDRKKGRQEKRQRRAKAILEREMTARGLLESAPSKKRPLESDSEDDMLDMEKEARLLKKVQSGKMTNEQFDLLTGSNVERQPNSVSDGEGTDTMREDAAMTSSVHVDQNRRDKKKKKKSKKKSKKMEKPLRTRQF